MVFDAQYWILFLVILAVLPVVLVWRLTKLRRDNRELREAMIEARRALEQAEQNAGHDPLTGLLNRRASMPLVEHEIKRSMRMSLPLSLMVVDIDHFKQINDRYGHDTGDRVLAAVSRILSESCRASDLVARWGGEEFLVLCDGIPASGALVLAEKLRQNIAEASLPPSGTVTVSLGVSQFESGQDFSAWFNNADKAMYMAKQAGRNQVAVFPDPESDSQGFVPDGFFTVQLLWGSQLECGDQLIDSQHQDLFAKSNVLIQHIVAREPAEAVLAGLRELDKSLVQHFYDEEQLLKKLGYKALAAHTRLHRELLDELRASTKRYRDQSDNDFGFIKFICHKVVVDHLVEEDRKFFPLVLADHK